MMNRKARNWLILAVLSIAVHSSFVTSQAMCPVISDRYVDTRLKSRDPNGPDFKEVSGLAFSPTQTHNGNPIFFAIADGGGDARIGIFDSESGKRLRTLKIDRGFFRNSDWESLTIGSCGRSGKSDTCLYIMDAGDNQARKNGGKKGRSGYKILKVREPKWKDYDDNETIPKSRLSRLNFDYRHSSSPTDHADCEAMFLDHKGWGDGESIGDIYLATKWDSDNMRSKNRLFRVPASAWSSGYDGSIRNYSLRSVGSYDYSRYQKMGGTHFMKTTWTSGEMSFDGTMIALGNLQKSYVFLRCPGTSVADALVNPRANSKACVAWSHPASGQVESFAWSPDRRYTLDIPEGDSPRMGWTKLQFDKDKSSRVCPGPSPPTSSPTRRPTFSPTRNPTRRPTFSPTRNPTPEPTLRPTPNPTLGPSSTPTFSAAPTTSPIECAGHIFDLVLHTEEEAVFTQWKLYNEVEELVVEGSGYSDHATVEYAQCLQPGLHTFEISNQSINGVPGWYQIWYDKTLLYDSRGEFGSWTEIMFASEFDVNPVIRKTPSPTQAPTVTTVTDVFGVLCGGICPGSFNQLANAQEVVTVGGIGEAYVCGTLDKRYQKLFATVETCDALQVSAQQAGCKCQATAIVENLQNDSSTNVSTGSTSTNVATDSTSTNPTSTTASKSQDQSLDLPWGLIGIGTAALFCVFIFCCCKCIYFGGKDESAEEETRSGTAGGDAKSRDIGFGLDDTSSKTVSDDSTALLEFDDSGSSGMTSQPVRAMKSALSNRANRFVTSYQLTLIDDCSENGSEVHPLDKCLERIEDFQEIHRPIVRPVKPKAAKFHIDEEAILSADQSFDSLEPNTFQSETREAPFGADQPIVPPGRAHVQYEEEASFSAHRSFGSLEPANRRYDDEKADEWSQCDEEATLCVDQSYDSLERVHLESQVEKAVLCADQSCDMSESAQLLSDYDEKPLFL